MSDSITFKCSKCGSKQFQIPSSPKPDDVVTCAGCGATGTYAALRDMAVTQAKDEIGKMFKASFGKNWKS